MLTKCLISCDTDMQGSLSEEPINSQPVKPKIPRSDSKHSINKVVLEALAYFSGDFGCQLFSIFSKFSQL